MMNRTGWTAFSALAAFNVFLVAGYQWTHASATAPVRRTLVELAAEEIEFTDEERSVLDQLEAEVLARRRALLSKSSDSASDYKAAMLAETLDMDRLAKLYHERLPERLEYLRYESARLHAALQRLSPPTREAVLDFLIRQRQKEVGRWVEGRGADR
jgi:hypothetical protein